MQGISHDAAGQRELTSTVQQVIISIGLDLQQNLHPGLPG